MVIGKGGANIRKIREDTGVAVDLEGNYSWENRIVSHVIGLKCKVGFVRSKERRMSETSLLCCSVRMCW